jgi:dCMP deaminase
MNESNNTHVRPSWDEYFMNIAKTTGARGTCDRGRVGCVIAKDKRIISAGYVGSPAGIKHCDEIGHEMHTVDYGEGDVQRHCVRTAHAETNAIIQAARFGVSTEGGVLYCMMTPCYACAKNIINAGIKRVVCEKDYHAGRRTKEIFKEAGVELALLNEVLVEYPDQN